MKDKVIELNAKNIESLPVNSIYWNYRNSDDVLIVKVVDSTFHKTSQKLISKFYKSISPISL